MFILAKEYRVISVIILKGFVNMLIFFSLILYQINHTNILYYYAKAILLYNLYYTFKNFYLYRVLIVSLISMNIISIFILLIFIEVEPNILDIFSRFYPQFIYRISMFLFLVIVSIIILSSLLIVSNYNDIVLYNFSSNKLNRFRFLFI